MPSDPPYLYTAYTESSRFSQTSFDPKAITRASWEPKPAKKKQDGPLLSFNRHPDAHMVLRNRSGAYSPMGARTKAAIHWLRRILLALRVLALNGAVGILVLMILLDRIETVAAWVMRITPGAVAVHCLYAIYHLSRDAGGRTPTSSAAYQIFASIVDLCTIGLYTYAAFTVNNDGDSWTTRLSDQDLLKYFVPAVYYTLVGSGGLHLVSLAFSLWLSWAFRRISLMPPDMNPLEDNLTARPMHKKNRSSVTTTSSAGNEKRSSTLSDHSMPGQANEGMSSPRTVPFMHTREGSRDSFAMNRSTRDLPNRQYQVEHRNSVPSMSPTLVGSNSESRPVSYRGAYEQVPLSDSSSSIYPDDVAYDAAEPSRKAKFTEAWAPTDSLISRTNHKNRNSAPPPRTQGQSYTALNQQYVEDVSDSDEGEMEANQPYERDLAQSLRPHPLRLNPPPTTPTGEPTKTQRAKTPFYPLGLGRPSGQKPLEETNANQQQIDISQDITDEINQPSGKDGRTRRHHPVQSEIGFYSKPYGDLKSATPPIIVGADRKVSSGNDYDARYSAVPYGRRNVSGKVAEEGRAGGNKLSRYGFGQYVGRNY